MPTYYEILGCDRRASYEEIKKCYHEQARKYHPDKSNKDSEQFFALDKAWKTLRDPDTRRQYDLEISKNDTSEMPLYCEIGLSEMNCDPEGDTCSFTCRCGGLYILNRSEVNVNERLKVPCDECSFHIDVLLSK